jgi:hypothetical protein
MGNQSSSEGGGRTFGRSGNSLGLSRSELEKRCRPSGLYDSCKWDDKAIRKLVGDGKLASRQKGCEDRTGESNQECPICFLYYKETNITKCCGANICTECYLQVKPQKDKTASCPFCNSPKVGVSVAKQLSEAQVEEQKKDEQRVVEARKRSQSLGNASEGSSDHFGSSLQQYSRARSESFNSTGRARSESLGNENINPEVMAMSIEERQRLEAEMKAQLSHPLTMRVEAEAAERRMENDRAYSQSQPRNSRFRRRRGRGGRDWNQIVDAFERGGNGQIQSLDDLVVLEAAILLSMGEEARNGNGDFDPARHARNGFPLVRNYFNNRQEETAESSSSSSSYNSRPLPRDSGNTALDTAAMLMRGISEEDQMAMAIAASLQDQNGGNARADGGDDDEEEEDVEVDGGAESHSEDEDGEISDVEEESGDDYDDYGDEASSSTDDEDRAYGGDAEVSSNNVEEDDTEVAEPVSGDESVDYDDEEEQPHEEVENDGDSVHSDDQSSDAEILES